jgi:hypothetical protein
MAKRNKKGFMGNSHIPYAQRLKLQQQHEIITCRDHAARIAMYCTTIALHDVAGIGYTRTARFSLHFRELLNEFYEDPDVGMAHAKERMAELGMEIEGEYFRYTRQPGETVREAEVRQNSLQAVQAALIVGAIAANDTFGFGPERQKRLATRIGELSKRYNQEGQAFLLEELEKIGFPIENGRAMYYTDESGAIVTPATVRRMQKG